MDLNPDFIMIQGVLLEAQKPGIALNKIHHFGGNKDTILNLLMGLHKSLSVKNYIKNQAVNDIFDEELNRIVLFLILNTELKQALLLKQYEHLTNMTPQLSTCLLANLIVGLDLSKHYCEALKMINANATAELLAEMPPCLKKCAPKVHLKHSICILHSIVQKLSQITSEDTTSARKMLELSSELLLNLSGFDSNAAKSANIDSIYEHMGYTILHLLDLLLQCDSQNRFVEQIEELLLKTCCNIMYAVTLDVFCTWAEVEEDGQALQSVITTKAYLFIEKYQKDDAAQQLISMLSTIAQKPKTINELIHQSDVPTMISMINKCDSNQREWFRALLNTHVLKNTESMKCVNRWAHLSTSEDVKKLLSMSVLSNDTESKQLVIKCASTLDLRSLISITSGHCFENGLNHVLNENIQQQIVLIFNKMKNTPLSEDLALELHLLLLQNTESALSYIFSECIKNSYYSQNLKTFFESIKPLATINNIGLGILAKEMNSNPPTDLNLKNYTALFNTLMEVRFCNINTIVLDLLLTILENSLDSQNYQLFKHTLEILNEIQGVQGNLYLTVQTAPFFNIILLAMKECRCKYLEFERLKQEVVNECVTTITRYLNIHENFSQEAQLAKLDDNFVLYYTNRLMHRNATNTLLEYIYPKAEESEMMAHLIKFLPMCVTQEWLNLAEDLSNLCGAEKTTELLCDCLILLCKLANSQETQTPEVLRMLNALQYYLQNVGIVLKTCIQPKLKSLEEDVSTTKTLCRLLKELPVQLKSKEGLTIANVISERSLRSLKSDKNFAMFIVSIGDARICQLLAQKILN